MQDEELNDILSAYNSKLEEARLLNLQSWVLNLQNYTSMQKQKANATLSSLSLQKKVLVILGILYGLGLLFLAVNSLNYQRIFFAVSTGAIGIITLTAVFVYVQQLYWIQSFHNTESLVSAQEKLTRLQHSTIAVTRILFLQMPFYCTFFISPAMIAGSPMAFILIVLPVAGIFTYATYWLYRNIDLKNAHKRWFRILFGSSEWTSLLKSQQFLDDIEAFKKEIVLK
ncbi:MAG: hypothetical protein EOO13_01350 [Chitinophagaceae bacterium]|nr:MAG: hypothetical protein EOO13_01350 [Chitinophagaceae bacterium]